MEKYSYFKPGEMIYLSDGQLNDQQMDALIDWSIRLANNPDQVGGNLAITISRQPGRELHFPSTPQGPVIYTIPNQDALLAQGIEYQPPQLEPRGPFSILPADVRELVTPDTNPEGFVDPVKLAQLIVRLDNARINPQLNTQLVSNGITLEVVSPNWLSSPGSETGGGGGPGSRPVPYNKTAGIPPYEIELPSDINNLVPEKEQRGAGVTVAILDTAPSLHDLAEAYEVYHKVDPAKRQDSHPLLESLLRPNGPLTVHPASYEELLRMRAVHLRDHNYKMTSHGLFVAGIIHSIAPAAELHLYEVLNPDGVGDLESIARGLWTVANEQYQLFIVGQERHLVVNCSLVLRIPLDGDPDHPNSYKQIQADPPITGHRLKDLYQVLLDKISQRDGWLERSGKAIMWICDLLFWCGSRVVAAAGNDRRGTGDEDDDDANDGQTGKKENGRPEACYPASFASVLGIGALPKGKLQTPGGKRETSTYSNLSDAPGEIGVTTLGGESGEAKGILGIYLGRFPAPHRRSPNTTHWAWWAGTSFATPILTGAIAAVLSGPTTPRTTEDAIFSMYAGKVIVNDQTDYQEDLFDVTQGP